jgi:hypothetical protein
MPGSDIHLLTQAARSAQNDFPHRYLSFCLSVISFGAASSTCVLNGGQGELTMAGGSQFDGHGGRAPATPGDGNRSRREWALQYRPLDNRKMTDIGARLPGSGGTYAWERGRL